MNGQKIIKRLIILFLVLNIVLAILNGVKAFTTYHISTQRIETITELLKKEGILIDAKLPRFYRPKGVLICEKEDDTLTGKEKLVKSIFGGTMKDVSVSLETLENDYQQNIIRVYHRGLESIRFKENEIIYFNEANKGTGKKIEFKDAKSQCENFIRRIGQEKTFDDSNLEWNVKHHTMTLTYYATYKNDILFNVYITFDVTNQGIKRAVMHLGKIEPKNTIKKKIYPVDVVLFKVENYINLDRPIYITDIKMGYYSEQRSQKDVWTQELIPVYKIKVKGLNPEIFVNAYTNEILE